MSIKIIEIDYNNEEMLRKIFLWRNDKDTRQYFNNTNEITKDIFETIINKYKDSGINPFIIIYNNIYIGIINFVRNTEDNNHIYIGINIDKNYRNKNIGCIALKLTLIELKSRNILENIYAKIKLCNIPSIKLFSKYFEKKFETDDYVIYKFENNYKYVLCSTPEYYSYRLFNRLFNKYNKTWLLITDKDCFNNNIMKILPIQCYFLHWPYIIPNNIYNNIECINFHTSNLPYGRGGSPLQNQIIENIYLSHIYSLRVCENGIDKGPYYNKQQISLQGNIFDIFLLISNMAFEMICDIIDNNISPTHLNDDYNNHIYKRIKNNKLVTGLELNKIYDQIRMRDFKYYEKTYIEIDNVKISFSRAYFDGDKIICDAEIINI